MGAKPAAQEIAPDDDDDYEVIPPPENLKHLVKVTGVGDGIDTAAIERAERAVKTLSAQFANWMATEVQLLIAARAAWYKKPTDPVLSQALFRHAHDIKGQATTFGYPSAARIGGSLSKLLDDGTDSDPQYLALVDQHVDAIRAIVNEGAKGDDNATATELARRLEEIVDAILED